MMFVTPAAISILVQAEPAVPMPQYINDNVFMIRREELDHIEPYGLFGLEIKLYFTHK
jgi:hypothetical protein